MFDPFRKNPVFFIFYFESMKKKKEKEKRKRKRVRRFGVWAKQLLLSANAVHVHNIMHGMKMNA